MSKDIHNSGPAGAVYGLGFLGAVIYFISQAAAFWEGAFGVFESHCLARLPGL